ncbi:hypothetical protein [Variovorax boronicumulans]|uniref:hypothetical protein n=1 Tax=Variovorax boronicumulans TaxID=436515 RepID=UPI001C590161
MAANLGALTVMLGLDAADYTRGLTKAEKDARAFGERIGGALRRAYLEVEAFTKGMDLAGQAVAYLGRQVDQIASFQGLSEKIGDTASAVQGLKLASDLSGVSLDSVAAASVKLTATLSGTGDETKNAGKALAALGLNLKDFKALTPTKQLEEVAQALAGFENGAGKTAVAVALLGKSGADLIPFLNDLADAGQTQIRLTNEQIAAIDAHQKAQARLRSEVESVIQLFVVQSIDAMTAFSGVLKTALNDVVSLGGGVSDLGSSTGVERFAEGAGRSLAGLIDYITQSTKELKVLVDFVGSSAEALGKYASGDFSGGRKVGEDFRSRYGLDAMGRKVAQIGESDGKTYVQKFDEQLAGIKRARFAAVDPRRLDAGASKPSLDGFNPKAAKSGGSKDDPTKKLLDNQLKEYQRAIKQEQELLQSRNKIIDLYYGENLVSIEDYYAARLANQEEATTKEVALIDQQIEALEKYKAAAKKDTERADAQGKINALIDEEAKLQRAAGETALEQSFKKAQALRQYKDSLDGVRASLLEMSGDSGAAAALRVEIQYRDLLARSIAQNDTAGQKLIETLKQQTIAQSKYNQEATSASQITARLQIEEDRIGLSRQLGATGELESLAKLGEARKAAVAQMKTIVEAQEAIARASGNPALILQAEQARLALDSLAASADPLADKFNNMFSDAAGGAFADFITGTKSASEAFKSFTTTIFSELTNLIAKDLFKQLFSGASGSGFNVGGLLSGIFGGGKAIGGGVNAGGLYEVAENRPEMLDVNGRSFLMMGKQRGNIDPNPRTGGGGVSVVIQQSFAAGTDRKTTDQAALQASRVIQRAQRNA